MLSKPQRAVFPIDIAGMLFYSGYSPRAIAKQIGWSHGYTHKCLQQIGLTRSRKAAQKTYQSPKPRSRHWRTCRQQARRVWSDAYGPIPKGMVIHHIDEDYTNNDLPNLEMWSSSCHSSRHHPKNPIPRGQRAERKAYQKQYFQGALAQAVCEFCGKVFQKSRYHYAQTTCSHSCGSQLFWQKRKRKGEA